MEQKTIWMRYLIIGISILISTSVFISCKRTDYIVKTKWIYINETGLKISYSPDYWSEFNVLPYDTTIYAEEMEGGEEVTAASYVAPLKPEIVFYGDSKCDTLNGGLKPNLGDGPRGMDNYENRKLGIRYYKFTYRFTQEIVDSAVDCK